MSKVHEALNTIVKNRDAKALNYCVNYAQAGIGMSGHELHVQVLYVLNNMQYWRGADAKRVREVLKAYVKQTS